MRMQKGSASGCGRRVGHGLIRAGLVAWALALPAQAADLLTAVNDALKTNPAYQATLDAYASAQQALPVARARQLPQLSIAGSYDYIDESVEGDYFGVRNIDVEDDFPRFTYGAFLRQAVFSGDLLLGKSQAEQRAARARFLSDVAEDRLIVTVCDAYFAVLAAQEKRRIAEARLRALSTLAEQVSGRADAGLALEAELKAAEASQQLAIVTVAESRNAVEAAYIDLEALTGQRYASLLPLRKDAELMSPVPADESAWTTRAKLNNPAILAQQMEVAAAATEAEKSRYKRYPKVDVVGSYTRLDNEGGVSGRRNEEEARIGVTASLPLYTGGLVSAEIALADSEQKRATSELAAITAKAVRDTRVAYFGTTLGKQKMTALQQALDASLASEQANRAGYESGTRTNAELLAAVEQRYTAEFTLSSARYQFLSDTLHLRQVAGALLTADLGRINRLLDTSAATARP